MLLRSIQLQRLLSFGPQTPPLELRPLNVLIGPNGSGKSNLIEAIDLLRAAPKELAEPVRRGGGIGEWVWKGASDRKEAASLRVVAPLHTGDIAHELQLENDQQRMLLIGETFEFFHADNGRRMLFQSGRVGARFWEGTQEQKIDDFRPSDRSILALRRDPERYPELTRLAEGYEKIRIYRDWDVGRDAPVRRPQWADDRNDFLKEDLSNLGLVLNRFRRQGSLKSKIVERTQTAYGQLTDIDVIVEGGTVQLFVQEGDFIIPAVRLSSGTLRFLALVLILGDPNPPPLVCIEEPELGLHPDLMPAIADLLRDAATRTQLIVTTHSDVLVDALSDTPEDVVVFEKEEASTKMKRLDKADLTDWLEKYSLGTLWRQGNIGGTRY